MTPTRAGLRNSVLRAVAIALAIGVAGTLVWLGIDTPGDRYGLPVASVAIGVWVVAMAGRVLWTRRQGEASLFGPLSFHPLYFLMLITSSIFAELAMQETDLHLVPNPDQPDFVPGLFTDLSIYFLAVHAGIVALIALYGHTRGRALETAAAVQVVFLTALFEPVLQTDIGAPLMLGPVLAIAAFALAERGEEKIPEFRWTPFGPPLVAFLLAGMLVTATAAYVQHSIVELGKVGALVLLALLLFQVVRGQRQVWLLWAAVVLPVVGMAIVHVAKMVEIGNNMGIEFAIKMRFTFWGLIGSNTIGLALAVDILLILAAFFWTKSNWVRAGLIALLVPIIPSLLSVRSSAGLVAIFIGLLVIAMTSAKRDVLVEVRRRVLSPAGILAVATLVSVVGALIFVPNPYRAQWNDEVSDPTTGRGVRTQLWRWSVEDIKHNPIVGVGLTDRRFDARTQHVPEFPFRDVTKLIERRLLLGGEGTEWRVFVWAQPHNILLMVLESMGIIGFAAFVWLCLSLGLCGISLIRSPMTRERWLVISAIAPIGGGLAWSFFALGNSVAYLPLPVWPMIGLLGGAYCMARVGQPEQLPRLPSGASAALGRLQPYAAPAAAAVLSVAFLGLVARPVAADAFYRRADEARIKGDFSDAIDKAKIARKLDPLSAVYADFLAQAYYRAQRPEREISTLERLVELQPETASNHQRIAFSYWYQGDFAAALKALERAVQLDPWNSLGSNDLYSLGLAYQFANRRQDAIDTFKEAFFIEPGLVNEGAWYPTTNPAFGPDLVLDPAYTSDINNPRLQKLLNQRVFGSFRQNEPPTLPFADERTLYLSDVLEEGYRDYQAELSDDPNRAHGMLSALSRAYSRAGFHERALELAAELSERVPDKSYVFYDLGLEYAALDRDDEARNAFLQAQAITDATTAYDIYEPFIHYQIGLLDRKAGNYEAALLRFRKTLDTYRWPYFPEAYQALADAARRTGHNREADETLDKLRYLLGDLADEPSR